jgi:transposase-like protein
VVEAVASGASRREAAELYEIAASTAVKWLQRLRETGSAALIEERSDATYAEMLAALAARQIKSSRGALWRFSHGEEVGGSLRLRGRLEYLHPSRP